MAQGITGLARGGHLSATHSNLFVIIRVLHGMAWGQSTVAVANVSAVGTVGWG